MARWIAQRHHQRSKRLNRFPSFVSSNRSQCKKCKRIISITANIANNTSGNFDLDCFLGLNTNNFYMAANFNNYIDSNDKGFDSLQIYEFIRDKFSNYCNSIMKWIPYSQIKILEKIARGGFGVIYKAIWLSKTDVAVKRFLDSKYLLNEVIILYYISNNFCSLYKKIQ